jgi:hypothetical protein
MEPYRAAPLEKVSERARWRVWLGDRFFPTFLLARFSFYRKLVGGQWEYVDVFLPSVVGPFQYWRPGPSESYPHFERVLKTEEWGASPV